MFDKKLFIGLFLGFVIMTVVGTLSHELGHYAMLRLLGFDGEISYNSTWIRGYEGLHGPNAYERFLFTLGGPLQTLLTGTFGLVLLFLLRRTYFLSNHLAPGQWLLIFLALFWLRPLANWCMWISGYFVSGNFSSRGDEIVIARFLDLLDATVLTCTGIFGALVLGIVIFRFVPVAQRFTFVLAGLTGGISGYLLWMQWLGIHILP